MLAASEAESEHYQLRHRRRALYFALTLAYGLQRILQPCLLHLLPSLLTNAGGAFGPLSYSCCQLFCVVTSLLISSVHADSNPAVNSSDPGSIHQERHLPLWASAALPAAVLADTLGPAVVLVVSLGGSALAVLLLPLAASAWS